MDELTNEKPNEADASIPGTDAYNQAMIAKAEGSSRNELISNEQHDEARNELVAEQTQADEPKLYAGKYKSEQELEKGLLELIKKKHNGDIEAYYKEVESTLGNIGNTESKPDDEAKQAEETQVNSTGNVLFDTMTKEFSESGSLSNESITQLKAMGIPDSVIETHKLGLLALQREQAAKIQSVDNKIAEITGGNEGFNELMTWAKDNLPNSVLVTLNNAYQANDSDSVIFSLEAIKQKYDTVNSSENSTGQPAKLIQGTNAPSKSGDTYANWKEVSKDMNDPRYKKDKAFMQKVQAKLGRSNFGK